MSLTLGVDVGGTKVAVGAVDEAGTLVARVHRPTPNHDSKAVIEAIADAVAALRMDPACNGRAFEAVGVGAAGFVNERRSTILFAPNLAWRDEPLQSKLETRLGMPVVVENDANAAAWGEARFGAGRGVDDLMVITVGTGLGGGIVMGGQLYRGGYGIAAEVGHMRVVPGGRQCGCGNFGCWEQYASGNALVRAAREHAATDPERNARLLELVGGALDQINGPEVTKAALDGDPGSLECFATIGSWLGEGMASLAAIMDPGRFVLGGGVSEAGELLLAPAREAFAGALTGRGHRPLAGIFLAALGNGAGMVGAADLARHR